MNDKSILNDVQDTFDIEIESLKRVKKSLDNSVETFIEELYKCKGNVVITGIGKSGYICKKIVATMQSLGIKSLFLHPAEALHGDLGVLSCNDIVIAISNSGETKEIMDIIPSIKIIGSRIFCLVGHKDSTLEKNSEHCIIMEGINEAYLDEMIPTSSTTATMVLGDSIAIALARKNNFTKEKFAIYHPKGQLGKKLTLKVSDIMISENDNSTILLGSTIEQAIFEMCRKPVGGVNIIDKDGKLHGIFTDGDLRRLLNKGTCDIKKTIVDSVMTRNPISVSPDSLICFVVSNIISKHNVSFFPVVDKNGNTVGTLKMIDVVKSGLFI